MPWFTIRTEIGAVNSTLRPIGDHEGHKGAVYALCVLDAATFLSAGGDGVVVRWRVEDPEHGEALIDAGEPVYCLAFDPEQGSVFVGTASGRLLIVDLASRKVTSESAHTKGIFRIQGTKDLGITCAGGDGVLSTWVWERPGVARPVRVRSVPLCEEKLRDLLLIKEEGIQAVACGDGAIRLLHSTSLNELAKAEGHAGGATSVTVHPSKPVLISGGKDGHLKAWRMDGTCVRSLAAHKGAVYAITHHGPSDHIVTGGRDAVLKVWDPDQLDPVARSVRGGGGHTHSINAVVSCGDLVLTGSDDRRIKRWRLLDR